MNIKLKVPLYKQKSDDMACGFICLQMVLAYYGKKLSYEEILKYAKIDKFFGCWWAQMGSVAIDLGFKAELINYNITHLFDADISKLKGKDLINRLENQKVRIDKHLHRDIDLTKEFINKGGKFSLRITKKEDLINWLKQGIPPILVIKIGPAYGKIVSKEQREKSIDQHGIVVYGYDGKNFLIHDPNPKENALTKMSEDLLMYSWYRAKCYTLLIRK